MARVTERNTRRAINRSLLDIRLTARDTVLSRRQAIAESFERIAHQFAAASNSAVTNGRPLTREQRARLETLALATLTRARAIYAQGGVDADTMVGYIEAALRGVHVGVIARAFGPDAARRADDAFQLTLAGLEADVEREIAELRRAGASVDALAGAVFATARLTLTDFLDAADENEVPSDEARDDLVLLLLGNDIDYGKYGLERSALTGIRVLPFASVVLAVSETYNATRAATSETLSRLGLVQTGRWTLSASHHGPDICDDFAARELGFGPGRYLVSSWPEGPHPHCACYMSDVRLDNFQQWVANWA